MTEYDDLGTQPDVWLEWAIDRGDQLSREEFDTARIRVGRNPAVSLMFDLHREWLLSDDAYLLAGHVWSMAEFPESYGRDDWLEVFRLARYCVDGQRVRRPRRPLTLYRGSTPEGRLGMSWTDSREIAGEFASGKFLGRERGLIWTATVEPSRLLCRIHDDGRNESEYVLNTAGLGVEPL